MLGIVDTYLPELTPRGKWCSPVTSDADRVAMITAMNDKRVLMCGAFKLGHGVRAGTRRMAVLGACMHHDVRVRCLYMLCGQRDAATRDGRTQGFIAGSAPNCVADLELGNGVTLLALAMDFKTRALVGDQPTSAWQLASLIATLLSTIHSALDTNLKANFQVRVCARHH